MLFEKPLVFEGATVINFDNTFLLNNFVSRFSIRRRQRRQRRQRRRRQRRRQWRRLWLPFQNTSFAAAIDVVVVVVQIKNFDNFNNHFSRAGWPDGSFIFSIFGLLHYENVPNSFKTLQNFVHILAKCWMNTQKWHFLFKISPNWQNFALSGHTALGQQSCNTCCRNSNKSYNQFWYNIFRQKNCRWKMQKQFCPL